MNGKSLDLTAEKLAQLRDLFPEVFSEGKVDFARLKDILGENVVFPNEHYELSWAGKAEARKEIQKQTTNTLIADKEGSIDFENAQNLFIEGENLEVLRILQKSYFGKVKMIYIDPPYNTGSDSFVYPDDYAERLDEYKKRTGVTDEEGYLNKQDLWRKNTRENGQFHSVWLSMMYSRLFLARNLLREDGVIFVSIDDNEQANLKLLLDEVFGQENFIESFVWKKSYGGGAKEKYAVTQHEYILMYAKSKEKIIGLILPPDEDIELRYYKYQDEKFEQRGGYRLNPLEASSSMDVRENLMYSITDPESGEKVFPKRQWWWSKDRTENALANNELVFSRSGERTIVSYKQYLKDEQGNKRGAKPFSVIEKFYTQHGTEDLRSFFDGNVVVQFPKPVGLLKFLVNFGAPEKDSTVLDFFAGSGTTAQAILELNEEDGGKRQFICIQMPEKLEEDGVAYKAGYRTIADISKTRIAKVVKKTQKMRSEKLALESKPQTLGLRSFKIAPSNFKNWRGDAEGEELIKQLDFLKQSEKEGSLHENMLMELLLKSGLALTAKVETIKTGKAEAYLVEDGRLFLFFGGYNKSIKELIHEKAPKRVVCLDSTFKGKDEDISNFKLELKEAGIELSIL